MKRSLAIGLAVLGFAVSNLMAGQEYRIIIEKDSGLSIETFSDAHVGLIKTEASNTTDLIYLIGVFATNEFTDVTNTAAIAISLAGDNYTSQFDTAYIADIAASTVFVNVINSGVILAGSASAAFADTADSLVLLNGSASTVFTNVANSLIMLTNSASTVFTDLDDSLTLFNAVASIDLTNMTEVVQIVTNFDSGVSWTNMAGFAALAELLDDGTCTNWVAVINLFVTNIE